jgi:hypothetical protein
VNDLYDFVPYLAALIAFLGSAYLFTRGPKEGRFDCVAPVVQTAVTLATLGLYVGLLHVNISPAIWVPALGVGIALGVYGSWSTTMELREDGSVRTLRTMWYLAVLAATIGISQVLIRQSYLHRNMFNGGLAALYFGTGTAVASNVTLLVRAMALRRLTIADILAPLASFDWRKGTEGSPWEQLRARMGGRGGGSASPAAVPEAGEETRVVGVAKNRYCPSCGGAVPARNRFCARCGSALT